MCAAKGNFTLCNTFQRFLLCCVAMRRFTVTVVVVVGIGAAAAVAVAVVLLSNLLAIFVQMEQLLLLLIFSLDATALAKKIVYGNIVRARSLYCIHSNKIPRHIQL